MQATEEICSLCETPVKKVAIRDGSYSFCCSGCHAVYNILNTKDELDAFETHPLFRQALQSGIISNPTTVSKYQCVAPNDEMETLYLEIEDLWCPSCCEIIKLMLIKEKGVRRAIIDYATDLASIEFSPRWISKIKIQKLISSLGYHSHGLESQDTKSVSSDLHRRFGVAAFCSGNIMMFSYAIYSSFYDPEMLGFSSLFAWLAFFLSLPVLFYSAIPILKRCLSGLKIGIIGMEALVTLGVSAAFLRSIYELAVGGTEVYFDSMTIVILFVLLGKIFESRAKFSAKNALTRLARMVPKRGRRSNGEFTLIKDVAAGEQLMALTGEQIVLDGIVIEGEGVCNEAAITGESMPILKKVGDSLLSGSILQSGTLTYRVTATVAESTLTKIINVIEQDISYKSSYIRASDKIVRWFTPLVIALALITLLWSSTNNIQKMLSVLLISCPCAIGIAAPLAESRLLNSLVKIGVIVRNRGCLPFLGQETTYVFDKTGTITLGNFEVIEGLKSLPYLDVLKGMVVKSNHPISVAISIAIERPAAQIGPVQEHVGKGLQADWDGHRFLLGSSSLMKMHGIQVLEKGIEGIRTVIYFAKDQNCLGRIILGDTIREEAKDLIKDVPRPILVSGDAESTVKYVANECGFTDFLAGCHPLEKRDYIDKLKNQKEVVAMLGDGINDAPALTGAHIGISVVNASDISIQVSDILLTHDNLDIIPKIRKLGRKGQRIIRQNLFWAFFYNAIGIGLAMNGMLSPIFSAGAMVTSSLIVLFNAKRIK